MKRNALRFVLPLMALLSIPFVYNSCQGGLPGSKAFTSAAASSSCKITSNNGVVTKFQQGTATAVTPFSAGKVNFGQGSTGVAKVAGSTLIPAGTELGVIINNQCLQANRDALEASSVISKAAIDAGGMLPQFDTQAYLWTLDKNYTEYAINVLAEQESCVVGVSWNKKYTMQSLNDPMAANQVYLPAIHASEAYDRFYAASKGGMTTDSGKAIILAAVDTGVDWTHPDIKANMWSHNLGYGIDIPTLGTSLVNYNPMDVSPIGHGTHVSGMMAAVSNNNVGITGVMPYRGQIMGIKIFKADSSGNLSTTSQYVYNGIKFAYLNGANVINLSLDAITNGSATDPVQEAGFDEAINAGVVLVVALGNADSGNNGALIDGVNLTSIPAMFATKAGTIGVGSIDAASGNKSFFSHYSTTYGEIGAPGAVQDTTGLVSTIPVTLGSYGQLAGTSQAAPQVSAAAGLVVGLIRQAYGATPTPAEVERLILAGAVKSSALTSYFKDGNRLDLLSLVQQVNHDYPQTYVGGAASTPPATTTTSSGCN